MKLKDKLYIGGSVVVGSFISGCVETQIPDYNVPETKIKDNYSNINSHKVVEDLKQNIRTANDGYSLVENKDKNKEWTVIVDQELEAINKATSLAVRIVVEKERHDYQYPLVDQARKDYLNTRLNSLLYNQNTAIGSILDSLKIDPLLQTVMQNDSISIGDYIDSKDQFLEYRIQFLNGGEHNLTDNGKSYIDSRKIRFSVYNWDKNALGVYGESSARPQLEFSKELNMDFENNDYTFRDVLRMASEK